MDFMSGFPRTHLFARRHHVVAADPAARQHWQWIAAEQRRADSRHVDAQSE